MRSLGSFQVGVHPKTTLLRRSLSERIYAFCPAPSAGSDKKQALLDRGTIKGIPTLVLITSNTDLVVMTLGVRKIPRPNLLASVFHPASASHCFWRIHLSSMRHSYPPALPCL